MEELIKKQKTKAYLEDNDDDDADDEEVERKQRQHPSSGLFPSKPQAPGEAKSQELNPDRPREWQRLNSLSRHLFPPRVCIINKTWESEAELQPQTWAPCAAQAKCLLLGMVLNAWHWDGTLCPKAGVERWEGQPEAVC